MTFPKGTLVTSLFLALPLVLWLVAEPPTASISYLGKILGVFGFAAFTLALLLAIRIPLQEKIFGDLGQSYRFHQTIGTLALMALVLHPVFLAWQYIQLSFKDAAVFLLPIGDLAKNLGLFSLIIMTVCIICTYYIRLPYHIWKKVHRYLALAFVFGAMHGVMIGGDIQTMPLLKLLFIIFLALGVVAILYRVLFNRLFVHRTPYVVSGVNIINEKFVDVTLTPKDRGFDLKPGQFAYITYMSNGVKAEEHPFSIAGSGPNGSIRFVTKKLGDFTNTLSNIVVGDEAMVEGPYGSFTYTSGGKTQCWIAGGIGITPFLAFAASLPDDYRATLYYAISDETENAVANDLADLAKRKSNLDIVVWNSKEKGFLTAASALSKLDPASTDVFLCGPGGMVKAMRDQLFALHVPHHHIHQEKFSMLP
ncbi:MAG: ferric reductase-like transmembrane domain-containing protein [Patescibacteria group bacterium]